MNLSSGRAAFSPLSKQVSLPPPSRCGLAAPVQFWSSAMGSCNMVVPPASFRPKPAGQLLLRSFGWPGVCVQIGDLSGGRVGNEVDEELKIQRSAHFSR